MNGETQPVYGPPTLQEAFSQYLLLETARAKNLEIPQQYYGVFVPKRVNEIATNRANVELIPDSQSEGGISFMVVERNLEKPLTKREDWNAWQADIEKTRRENEGELFIVLPSAPPTVNRLQARFSDKINKGELTLNDRILMELK